MRPRLFFDTPFYERSHWQYKFCWWPQRSDCSLRSIWLEWAYRGTWVIAGPGDPVSVTRWLTKEEFITFCLTKENHA